MSPLFRDFVERRTITAHGLDFDTFTALTQSGGEMTYAGVRVSPENALQVGAVYACVTLIAEAAASCPVHLIEKRGRERVVVDDRPEYQFLAEEPNPEMDAGEFWRLMAGHKLLRGNAYAYIQRDNSGKLIGLWPLRPDGTYPVRLPSGKLAYVTTIGQPQEPFGTGVFGLLPEEVLHFRAFSLDGIHGLGPVDLMRQTIGTAKAIQEHGGRFFSNGARPGGVIQVGEELSDKAFRRLRKQWNDMHQGGKKAHLMAILENGATWQDVGMTNEAAQFLESHKFTVSEIARWFGIPPHLVGDVDRSTSWGTGIEEQTTGFSVFTLRRTTGRFERTTKRQILRGTNVSAKFDERGLLRGNFKDRMAGYKTGREIGLYSINDIHYLEDEPGIGPEGDKYQTTPVGGTPNTPNPANPDAPAA